jgi:phenylalanyl-tRNA synthetase alpha chain
VSSTVSYLSPEQLRLDLGIRDLSEPTAGLHGIQILIDRAVERLSGAWNCEVRWCRGPRIVPVADNYDRLGYAAEAITRETRYTRYVDAGHMLRSHSSAMVPPALRRLAGEGGDDVLLACPGIVYRRDTIDWQHTGTPHQLDLWRITRRAVSGTDLDEMIAVLLDALTPGLPHRQQPRTHPYTLHGRQVDVRRDDRWVEVWECGQAHPQVLAAAGLGGRSGLALGMGLDRLLMLAKRIPDIRLLRSGDPRIAHQMLDLARYQPVSSMPAVTRDLSVAVPDDDDEETLGDRVRNALGASAGCVEEVRVLSATAYQQLPPSAIGRLGAKPGQKNLLVRIVLRDLDKTLTSEAANALRDRIYRALHQGTEYQWAERPLANATVAIDPALTDACRDAGRYFRSPNLALWYRALSAPQAITLRDRCSAWRRAHCRRSA